MGTATEYKNYNSIDDLPATFKVNDLAQVMGINKNAAYELAKENGFPSITIGTRILVIKEQFKKWLELKSWEQEFTSNYYNLSEKDKKIYRQSYWEAIDFLTNKLEVQLSDSDRRQIRQVFK